MSKSADAFSAFLQNWSELKKQRPAEGDFSVFGYPLSYASMDELFTRWEKTLSVLDRKGFWLSSPEVAIADAPLAAQINNLSSLVSSALSNGVSWLLSAQFLDISHSIQSQLSTLTRRQARLNSEIAKHLENRSAANVERVLAASAAAHRAVRCAGGGTRRAAFPRRSTAVSAPRQTCSRDAGLKWRLARGVRIARRNNRKERHNRLRRRPAVLPWIGSMRQR